MSVAPRSAARASADTSKSNREDQAIASGYPSGCASTDHWRKLRLRTTGPITQLGPKPPALRLGAHTRSLVLLARGPGPYRLVWGGEGKDAQPSGAVTIDQLLPTRRDGDPLPADMATVVWAPAAAAPVAPVPASAAAPQAATPWLWGALLAGLALMGFMAWSLLRAGERR